MLVTVSIAIVEFIIVKSDIKWCLGDSESINYNRHLFNVIFLIFLRDVSFYLFFTYVKLYLQTKSDAFIEKKEALRNVGVVMLLPLRGTPISINIGFVSYFSQRKNYTFIHWTIGNPSPIYSSLNYIQSYLNDYCLRVNKDTIITFTNIISYNEEKVIVIDGKTKTKITLPFFKKNAEEVLTILRKKVPKLEEKNTINSKKKSNETINDDKNRSNETIKDIILEEIQKKDGINALNLADILEREISRSTLIRRLNKLKEAGKIEYKGSRKKGGYYII